MNYYQDEQFLGRRVIPGITSDMVAAELMENPIVFKYWKKNPEEIQQRLIDTMMRTPSDSDCPGFIYGFRNLEEYNPKATAYSIKMGRTKRLVPQQRIFEWQRDDNHQYVEIFTIRSEYNMKLEALVHLVFAYARKTKVINGKNRIEWFTFDEKVPTAAVTNLLNLIMENIHEKECKDSTKLLEMEKQQQFLNQIVTRQNEQLRQALDKLKRSIIMYIKKGNYKCIQHFKLILNENDYEKAKTLAIQTIIKNMEPEQEEKCEIDVDQGTEAKKKIVRIEVKLLKKNLFKLRDVVETIEGYQKKYGLKFNFILGRIKQAIYFGLKGGEEPIKENEDLNIEEILDAEQNQGQKAEPHTKNHQICVKQGSSNEKSDPFESQKKEKSYEKNNIIDFDSDIQSTASQTKKYKQDKVQKKSPKSALKQFPKEKYWKIGKLSLLYTEFNNKNIAQGETIINILDGQFDIDISKHVKHNLIIMARQIKVSTQWNVKFYKEGAQSNGSKLNLVIMGRVVKDAYKIKLPKSSKNGIGSIISVEKDDSLLGLDDYLKENPEKLKSEFYEGVKKIFNQWIK